MLDSLLMRRIFMLSSDIQLRLETFSPYAPLLLSLTSALPFLSPPDSFPPFICFLLFTSSPVHFPPIPLSPLRLKLVKAPLAQELPGICCNCLMPASASCQLPLLPPCYRVFPSPSLSHDCEPMSVRHLAGLVAGYARPRGAGTWIKTCTPSRAKIGGGPGSCKW